jgi:hypothetical protein
MEHDDMASENPRDQRTAPKREPRGDKHSSPPPVPQSRPPILGEGLESLRSDHC